MSGHNQKTVYTAIGFAVLATIIWSGNFIVARGVANQIPPISLAFFRWLTASVIIFPFAIRNFKNEIAVTKNHIPYLFWTSLTGIALFNTLVYVAGHYSSAINLALIGTTSAPVFAMLLAAIFLREKISLLRTIGLLICISGIVLLLSGGSIQRLLGFRFSTGDWWVLTGALCFSIYTILVRKKPPQISPLNYLFIVFGTGTLLLFPFFLIESANNDPIQWNFNLGLIILYLGLGTSVISFWLWNIAISKLGSARTALFGNLIPVFSSIEAVLILHEEITVIHIVSGLLVITGLIIANVRGKRKELGIRNWGS